MKRYALRNQNKLIEAFGTERLDIFKKSLDEYFKKDIIKFEKLEGFEYDFLFVDSVAKNSEITFQFAIVRQQYDVYILAYYSCIG